jgi:hypothetical protein
MCLNKTNNCYFNNLLQALPAFGSITTCSTRRKKRYGETTTINEIFLQIDRIFYKSGVKNQAALNIKATWKRKRHG